MKRVMYRLPRYVPTANHPDSQHMYLQELYKRSVNIKRTASSLFNLGVTHYHLSE